MISLEGKVAVVTGASRGIGAALALMLADQGVKLGLASRAGDDLGIVGAVAMPTDVRDRAQVQALVSVRSCKIERLPVDRTGQNPATLKAACEIDWITLQQESR